MKVFYALATIYLFGDALAQVPSLGGCPAVDVLTDFDIDKYLGTWYEAKRFFAAFELGAKCVVANYTSTDNSTTIGVENSQINSITGNPTSIKGVGRVPDSSEPGKLKVKFTGVPVEGDYWVLGTDYETYALVYSCTNLTFVHFTFAWILTRDQNPPQSVIDQAIALAKKNGLNTMLFMTTNQDNC